MDYCYTCRRTLNGALVCPGCGAYAPDIAPPAVAEWRPSYAEHARAGVTEYARAGEHPEFASAQAQASASPYEEAGAVASGSAGPAGPVGSTGSMDSSDLGPEPNSASDEASSEAGTYASVLGPKGLAPTLHRGRAARRRQMARWKKNRRRAAAATAVALFGGGLTVAAMPSNSKGTSTTASAGTPVSPTALRTDGTSSLTPPSDDSAPAGTHGHTATVPQQRRGHAAPSAAQPTYPATDNTGTTVLPRSASVTPTGTEQVSYSGSQQPTQTLPATSTGTGTGTSTSTDTGSDTGNGTSADSGNGTSTGTGSDTGTGTGSGTGTGGTTAPTTPPPSTPPSTPPPTTTPTPPPPQLCVLILCLG